MSLEAGFESLENAFKKKAAAEGRKSCSCSDNAQKKEAHHSIEAQGNQHQAKDVACGEAQGGVSGSSQKGAVYRVSQHRQVGGREEPARQKGYAVTESESQSC
jgi:hypothetical protein